MGYETYFELQVDPDPDLLPRGPEQLEAKMCGDLSLADHKKNLEFPEDSCKWYEYDDDMIKYSKKHPAVLFQLDGDGEHSHDFWRAFYKNGKTWASSGEVIYPEFDESMLK